MKPVFTTKHIARNGMVHRNIETINRIIVHSSATRAEVDVGRDEIDRWHQERGFVAVGYHFVIRRDGSIEKGRDISYVGAHAKGSNLDSIGICMVGGLAADGGAEDNFTPTQFKALVSLIDWLQEFILEVPVGQDEVVMGHRQVGATLCPSFDVPDKLRELRAAPEPSHHLKARELMREWRRLSNEANDIDFEMRRVQAELDDVLQRVEWLKDD